MCQKKRPHSRMNTRLLEYSEVDPGLRPLFLLWMTELRPLVCESVCMCIHTYVCIHTHVYRRDTGLVVSSIYVYIYSHMSSSHFRGGS
jgi:hypothetical protein